MKRKISFEIVPINKFDYRLEEEITAFNNEEVNSLKEARIYIKDNFVNMLNVLSKIYKGKMNFYKGFEIRVFKSKKLKATYRLGYREIL